ncbi:MAG TPA: MerR family transcriptional regulator [Polyangiaceae bacterium]|nr:MerR family transcriptional regulator [Polyangiaceae bacterium]
MAHTLKTGQVAAQAGVNVQTLRYYERRGLLREPKRRRSGYREYTADAVQIIRFIKRAQELGFTLTEIEELLRLRIDQHSACSEVRGAAEAKITDIEHRIDQLAAMSRALTLLVASCAVEGSPRQCPILEALDEDELGAQPDTRRSCEPGRTNRGGHDA